MKDEGLPGCLCLCVWHSGDSESVCGRMDEWDFSQLERKTYCCGVETIFTIQDGFANKTVVSKSLSFTLLDHVSERIK